MAVPSEIAAAKVKFASESTAAELLIEYQKRVFSQSDFRDMRWSGETDEGFENAIFEKGSPYLRLLLLESVTSHDVAVKLWAWADQSTELTSEQVLAVKRTLIEGSAAKALLFEGEYGQFNDKGKIGIVESLSRGEYWPLFSVFKNPWLKRLVAKVLLKEGVFESIDDKLFPTLIELLAFHPALNHDDSNEHGPDLAFWDLEKGIKKWLVAAPASAEWHQSFEYLFDRMQPEIYSFRDFPISNFIEKWKKFNLPPDPYEQDTVLTRSSGEVLIYVFAAKFGHGLLEGEKIPVDKALAMDMTPVRAAYFGRTWFSEKDLQKILSRASLDVRTCLFFNPVALRIPSIRRELTEFYEDDHVLKSRLEYLSARFPRDFEGDVSGAHGGSEVAILSRALDQRFLKLESKLSDITRFILLLAALVVLPFFFNKT